MNRASLLVIFLWFPFLCFGQQQPPEDVSGGNQQPPAKIQNQESSVSAAPNLGVNDKSESSEQTASAISDSPSNITIAHFTIALACIAFVQAVIYGVQCYMMKQAIDQSRHSSERALRAYIGVITEGNDPENVMERELLEFPDAYTVLMRNSGQTPAYRVGSRVDWQSLKGRDAHWIDDTPPHEEANRSIGDNEKPSYLTIGSSEKSHLTIKLTPHPDGSTIQDAFAKLKNGEVSIFIYGHISYYDVFDGFHYTEFCYVLRYCKTAPFEIWNYEKHCNAT